MLELQYIPKTEFDRMLQGISDPAVHLPLFADMCRLNTLVEIKKAGSGHLGSSLSAMDIVALLYLEILNVRQVGLADPNRDIFFSSKGHDVPGLYAVLVALGLLPEAKLGQLRRLGGLDGHPDVHVAGMESNTGSLGMGISKGRGIQRAKKLLGRGGRVFVMTGDGELQEGQIWESLQTSIHQRTDLTVIVDHNKLQTDMLVEDITSLGNIATKLRAFGAAVVRCDGHDFAALRSHLASCEPGVKVIIADTIKGKGVSFMEEISTTRSATGKYRWHSGAPADEPFMEGFLELRHRIDAQFAAVGLGSVALSGFPAEEKRSGLISKSFVAAGYGEELVRLGGEIPGLVVLDGDLSADCKIRAFEEAFPNRFIENGIAEQDMVSMAGGLARQGLLPVCNSFSSFLCARANEQIYNNACEGTKIIYAAHFAGMIPAGPGKSHQSIRDIGLLGSLPNLVIVQPGSVEEARAFTRWAVVEAKENVCLRMNIGPSPREIPLPSAEVVHVGRGSIIKPGGKAIILGYGPVMLSEALTAAELVAGAGLDLAVGSHPWLNRFEAEWLTELAQYRQVYVVEDHMTAGGMGERLIAALAEVGLLRDCTVRVFGLTQLPACGTPIEVLRHHGLDGASLARGILGETGRTTMLRQHEVFNTLEAAQ